VIKTLTDSSRSITFWLVSGLLFTYLIFHSFSVPPGDFGNYYFGSLFFKEGIPITDIYEPAAFNLKIYESGIRNSFVSYTAVPPFSILAYLPFTFLDFTAAKFIFNLLSAILFLYTMKRLLNHLHIPIPNAVLLLPALLLPIQSNIYQGQSYLFIFSLTAEGYLAYEKGNRHKASLFWAVSILLKIFPAILLFYLIAERDGKSFFKTVLYIVLFSMLTSLAIGTENWIYYHQHILPRLFAGEINNTFAYQYQSVQVFLRNLFVPDLMHNPNAPLNAVIGYEVLARLFKGIVIACTFAVSLNRNTPSIQKLSVWLLCGLLVTGYGTTYSLVLLALHFIAFTLKPDGKPDWRLFGLVFIISNIPVYLLREFPLPLQYPRLIALIVFWVICIRKLQPVWKPVLIILSLAFLLPLLWIRNETPDAYFLKQEEALLIYNFELENNHIRLFYFDQNGPQTKIIRSGEYFNHIKPYPFSKHQLGIEIRTREQIKKAVYSNNKIIYLTDKGRGPGFYTLRFKNMHGIN